MPRINPTILEAALEGLQAKRAVLEEQITNVRRSLGGGVKRVGRPVAPIGGRKRRTLSAAARKSISAAQKKRWAAFKKQKSGG
jgi:hypothetical protein